VLKRFYEPEKEQRTGENYIMRSFILCTLQPMFFLWFIKSRREELRKEYKILVGKPRH
jgi:hypothetical protein